MQPKYKQTFDHWFTLCAELQFNTQLIAELIGGLIAKVCANGLTAYMSLFE